MTTEVRALSHRKMALQALIGALAGGGGMLAAMWLLEGETLAWRPSQIILVGVGLIYALTNFGGEEVRMMKAER